MGTFISESHWEPSNIDSFIAPKQSNDITLYSAYFTMVKYINILTWQQEKWAPHAKSVYKSHRLLPAQTQTVACETKAFFLLNKSKNINSVKSLSFPQIRSPLLLRKTHPKKTHQIYRKLISLKNVTNLTL